MHEHEQRLSLGLVTWTGVAMGWVWAVRGAQGTQKSALKIGVATTLTIMILMTQLPHGYTLWKWLYPYVPGAQAVRAVSRVGVFLLFFFGIGFAVWLDSLIKNPRRSRWALLAILPFCILEQGRTTPSFDRIQVNGPIEWIQSELAKRNCRSFLYSPEIKTKEPEEWQIQLDGMWAEMHSNIPTLNGYSGNIPPNWAFSNGVKISRPGDAYRLDQAIESWLAKSQLPRESFCLIR